MHSLIEAGRGFQIDLQTAMLTVHDEASELVSLLSPRPELASELVKLALFRIEAGPRMPACRTRTRGWCRSLRRWCPVSCVAWPSTANQAQRHQHHDR